MGRPSKKSDNGFVWSSMERGGREEIKEKILPSTSQKSNLSAVSKLILMACFVVISLGLFCILYTVVMSKMLEIPLDDPVLYEPLKMRSLKSIDKIVAEENIPFSKKVVKLVYNSDKDQEDANFATFLKSITSDLNDFDSAEILHNTNWNNAETNVDSLTNRISKNDNDALQGYPTKYKRSAFSEDSLSPMLTELEINRRPRKRKNSTKSNIDDKRKNSTKSNVDDKRKKYIFETKLSGTEEILVDPAGLVEFHTIEEECPYLTYTVHLSSSAGPTPNPQFVFYNRLSDQILGRETLEDARKRIPSNSPEIYFRGLYITCEEFFGKESLHWTVLDYFQKMFKRCEKAGAISKELKEKYNKALNSPVAEEADVDLSAFVNCKELDSFSENDPGTFFASSQHPFDICYGNGVTVNQIRKNITISDDYNPYSENSDRNVDFRNLYIKGEFLFLNIATKQATRKLLPIYMRLRNAGAISPRARSKINRKFKNNRNRN